MELSMLRLLDAQNYLSESYRLFAVGNRTRARHYLALSIAMKKRARRHWLVATHGVER